MHISHMKSLGQFFTTNEILQNKVVEFIISYSSGIILEPSVGRGDLVKAIQRQSRFANTEFHLYEIDTSIPLLQDVRNYSIGYCDFLTADISMKYSTIVGNPPYVKTSKGNLYVDFVKKCFHLLQNEGELIFIVPSDFFKLTCASKLIESMMSMGSFTHVFHPNNEKMFDNASIDIMVFRYWKCKIFDGCVIYNGEKRNLIHSKGLITFRDVSLYPELPMYEFQNYFHCIVGMIRGKEDVYKNNELGNISVINGKEQTDKYIFIESFPSECSKINEYLQSHRQKLIERKIRKFNDSNWYEWGAPRNIPMIRRWLNTPCIYLHTLTRKEEVAFIGNVNYFGGGLLCLIPKQPIQLKKIVEFLNRKEFKQNFLYSGRFKIGQRQFSYSRNVASLHP